MFRGLVAEASDLQVELRLMKNGAGIPPCLRLTLQCMAAPPHVSVPLCDCLLTM